MKEKLIAIFNAMKLVETRGESTLVMADCVRELANIINAMDNDKQESEVPTNE